MSDCIWISTAPGHAGNMRPFKHDVVERDRERFENGPDRVVTKIKEGYPLSVEDLASEIFGTVSAEEKDYRLPDLFHAYGYWVVSSTAADVLRSFDLGGGGLYPVKVMKQDRATPVRGDWFCINFGNRKSAIVPGASPKMRHRYIRNGEKGWFPPFVTKDGDVAVSLAALSGPDIWIDPDVGDAFFVSNALAKALKKAKADKGFFLSKCRVI
jgi:hypothetical protein